MPEITQTYNLCGVQFNIYKGPNGISVSGGADSALLLYFLLKYSSDRVHIFTFANSAKKFKNAVVSVNVIQKCAELTGNYNFEHHVDYSTETIDSHIERLPFEYLDKKAFNVLYAGITNMPPVNDRDSFYAKFYDDMRNPNEVRSVFRYGFSYIPWTNYDKKKIAEIYQEYNLIDTLYPTTRSCEWDESISEKDPGLGHCGKCWWCNERQWAFGKL